MFLLHAQCGEIKEVRLVRNRAGRSKGYAYVEYQNEVIMLASFPGLYPSFCRLWYEQRGEPGNEAMIILYLHSEYGFNFPDYFSSIYYNSLSRLLPFQLCVPFHATIRQSCGGGLRMRLGVTFFSWCLQPSHYQLLSHVA